EVGSGAVHALQQDRAGADRDQRVAAEVLDEHAGGERRGGDAERGDVQQVLSAGRIGIEAGDDIVAEACGEQERVVAGAAVHAVVAGAADDGVGPAARIDDVVAALAVDHVGNRTAGDLVV